MKLSNRTFGVEFELVFTKQNLIKLINENKKFLFKNAIPLKYEYEEWKLYEDYKGTYSQFLKEREECAIEDVLEGDNELFDFVETILEKRLKFVGWETHDDGSLEGFCTMEIVTPILKGKEGLRQIKKFLNYFGKFASVNETCGLHVHVGASDIATNKKSTEMFAAAILYYSTFESMFDSLVHKSRRGNKNEYTKSPNTPEQVSRNLSRNMTGIGVQQDRYRKINLQAIHAHGTIEFRHMHGTLDYNIVSSWVKICTAYVDMIKDNHSVWSEVTTYNKKVTLGASEFLKRCVEDDLNHIEKKAEIPKRLKSSFDLLRNNLVFPSDRKLNQHEPYADLCLDKSWISSKSFQEIMEIMSHHTRLGMHNFWRPNSANDYKIRVKNVCVSNSRGRGKNEYIEIIPNIEEKILAIKKKISTKSGTPKGIDSKLIDKIKKVNADLYPKKLAA